VDHGTMLAATGASPRELLHERRVPASAPVGRRRLDVSADEVNEMNEAFDMFDPSGTGTIDYQEARVCFRALGFDVNRQRLAAMIGDHDRERTGHITRAAYVEIASQLYMERTPEVALESAFSLFDDQGTGKISRKDLRRVCRELGEALSDDELQAMIDEFDTDGDGLIDIEDFKSVLQEATIF